MSLFGCLLFLPNIFCLGFGSAIAFADFCFVYPYLYKNTNFYVCITVNLIISVTFYAMWVWAWLTVALGDPGSVEKDLKRRGLYEELREGIIPERFRNLPICHECCLPIPINAKHCDTCHTCHLRYDHHCPVFGKCIADKNFKPFFLSFMYGGLFCLSLVPPTFIMFRMGKDDFFVFVIALTLLIYGLVLGLMLIGFGFGFFQQNAETISVSGRISKKEMKKNRKKLFKTFGKKWYEIIIPIQRETTDYAWQGINMEDEYETFV